VDRANRSAPVTRFGVFEVDPQAEELRKNGLKLRLRGQPFHVLAMLLERPGEVVTREQLQQRLWPDGTFVDFDHSLNTAINKIREALGDSAENPRFVETLPRRGYRLVAAVENSGREIQTGKASPEAEALANANFNVGGREKLLAEKEPPHRRSWWTRGLVWLAALSVLIMGGITWFYFSRLALKLSMLAPMKVVRLTSFPGSETDPALSPDGKMVAFVWDGENGDNPWASPSEPDRRRNLMLVSPAAGALRQKYLTHPTVTANETVAPFTHCLFSLIV
jgi:DNA-binding winged helix-turn-helix (wHTH) protein